MRRRIVIALLLGSAVLASARPLRDALTSAWSMRAMNPEERKRYLFGSWYGAVKELRAALPENAAIDFVIASPEARDLAVFAGTELAPRPLRFFEGWEGWRARKRAVFFRDRRAANHPDSLPPGDASAVVLVDPRLDPPLRRVK